MPALLISSLYTRSSYNLEDAIDRVLGDLGYRNNNFITSGDVRRWLNEAQTILARDTRAFHVTTVSGVTSGIADYPLPSEATGRAITIEGVMHDGIPLPCVTEDYLFAQNRYWQTAAAGTPLYYYHRGFSAISLYPKPDTTDADALTIRYTAIPPLITEEEDLFYVPHGCEDALITYACWKACGKDAHGEGKARLSEFRDEWKLAHRRALEVSASVNEHEPVRYGERSIYRSLTWYPISGETVATSL